MTENFYKYNPDFIPEMTQNQDELNFLIQFMIDEDVQSILTFGVDNAGVEYRIAKAYTEANKKCHITGLDWGINDNLKHAYAKILGEFPSISVNFVRLDLRRPFPYFLLGNHEFTFIDADHSYESVKKDFALALKHTTRFIGFHDIFIDQGEVGIFWKEIKNRYETKEFSKIYGIGIAIL